MFRPDRRICIIVQTVPERVRINNLASWAVAAVNDTNGAEHSKGHGKHGEWEWYQPQPHPEIVKAAVSKFVLQKRAKPVRSGFFYRAAHQQNRGGERRCLSLEGACAWCLGGAGLTPPARPPISP